jgi:hypothetical protein
MALTDDTHFPFGDDLFAGLPGADVSDPELWHTAQALAFYAEELERTQPMADDAGVGRQAVPDLPRGEVDRAQQSIWLSLLPPAA